MVKENSKPNSNAVRLACLVAIGALLLLLTVKSGKSAGGGGNQQLRSAESSPSAALSPEHKLGRNDAGTIWIINQPKCGTGSLEWSVWDGLGCELSDGAAYEAKMPKLGHQTQTRYFDCPNDKKLFRSHSAGEANLVKGVVDEVMEGEGTKPDRCLVVTAVRDPRLSIPSRFFETKKKTYCHGKQSRDQVLGEYDRFLSTSNMPSKQAETTAHMLRLFGVTDIRAAMEQLTGRGYAFFDGPDPEGPWAGCELLFLQIDYEESNQNLDVGLDHGIEGVTMHQNTKREDQCPKAADNYHAMIEHGISQEHIDRYAETNPEIRDIIAYYKSQDAASAQ
eukprot:CAMPEP_0183296314 /NCGR_PEP_ID=MMETSP0160_2-20130417/3925_1 /TAXON_ID=2839 ORGANISM="Odontella Sinensis, Strain Grunow 1884" /NCGR_SAMPLE_ID=MMETSP0160_2 /ASSEMBLY_ACC=CAM_ASM_000250 /LENGTH=334 /DNA_ID=CAMNT_0025457917 /DNA_START=94 /DNA_END=1098 /DNA_ORIENTATION=+